MAFFRKLFEDVSPIRREGVKIKSCKIVNFSQMLWGLLMVTYAIIGVSLELKLYSSPVSPILLLRCNNMPPYLDVATVGCT